MKVTKSQLIKIIKEELNEYGNYSAAAGADLRAAQLAGGGNPVQSEEEAELTLGGLVGELRVLLEEWQEKEYPSDEARYEGYYDDILQVTERYDPCAHPGESCEDAHPDQSHEECIMQTEEEEEELQEKKKKKKKDDNWLKDVKSTGECTPISKSTCTGRKKSFAKYAQGKLRKTNLERGKNPHGPG
jgi:hypothetical protein